MNKREINICWAYNRELEPTFMKEKEAKRAAKKAK